MGGVECWLRPTYYFSVVVCCTCRELEMYKTQRVAEWPVAIVAQAKQEDIAFALAILHGSGAGPV